MFRPAFVCVLLLFLSPVSSECDQCQFTADDAGDCKVYGKIDGNLIAWNRADSDCLDNYNIKINSIEPSTVGCSPTNVNSFVNAVKFGSIPNSVLAGLGVSEGGFFDEVNNANVLKDEITIDGQTYDCKTSNTDCYNAMKTYFATSPGSDEMMDVCEKTINQVFVDRELEQGIARNNICTDINAGQDPPVVCGELRNEMVTQMAANPNKDCSGFQFGSDTTVIPGCENVRPQGGGSSSGPHFYLVDSLAIVLALCLLANGL